MLRNFKAVISSFSNLCLEWNLNGKITSSADVDTDQEKKTAGNGKGAKRKRYRQDFRDTWLEDKLFKFWLMKKEDGGKTVPYCKVCRSKLSCAKTALLRHAETNTHQREIKRSMNLEKTQPNISNFMGSSQSKVPKMEIKLCTFLAENNLPISLKDVFIFTYRMYDLFVGSNLESFTALPKH